MEFSMPTEEYKEYMIEPSTIENVDAAIYEHIDEVFNISTTTNRGSLKVPVIWIGAERAFQLKSDRTIRDSVGKLVLPLISIERVSMEKDKSFKGPIQAHLEPDANKITKIRQHPYRVVSVLNHEKTIQFNNAKVRRDNNSNLLPQDGYTKVYDEFYIPLPTYVKIIYNITLRTEYQQQMNDLITPFISRTGQINHFVMKKNGHLYEAFIEPSFDQTNNLNNLGQDERKFETKVSIRVLGYVVGSGDANQETPKILRKESFIQFKTSTERIILEEDLPFKRDKSKNTKILSDFE